MYKDLIFEKILFTIRMCFEPHTKVLEVPFSSVKGQNNIIHFFFLQVKVSVKMWCFWAILNQKVWT